MATSDKITKCIYGALLFVTLINVISGISAETNNPTPARLLAKQTGAAQFEEERYETRIDCNEHKHHLKKRSSDEDVDYEVYQGVVGRPGIDFPIYPRIPKTSFSCRSFGNGYFADMETDCQVFHICEDGRKISFLCPNGTIFQQSELTCDWWFKVNCLGSPGYYADSAELLSKQRVQRVRPSVPVQGFNIIGGGLNIKPRVSNQLPRSRQVPAKSERRFDSNEEPSLENVDFDDISGERQLKGQKNKLPASIDSNNNENESQITAESGSFIDGRRRNSFTYDKSHSDPRELKSGELRARGSAKNNNGNSNGNGARGTGYVYQNESRDRARNGQRGQHRYREDKKSPASSSETSGSNESRDSKRPITLEQPERDVVPVEGSARFVSSDTDNIRANSDATSIKPEFYEPKTTRNKLEVRPSSTTPFYPAGTYSTARRLDTTRSTPFYTPTVPSVAKSKNADQGKTLYIKGGENGGGISGVVPSTPNPNRINAGQNSNLFLESSTAPKPVSLLNSTTFSTLRPFIIGMRHNYDLTPDTRNSDVPTKSPLNVALPGQPGQKIKDTPTTTTIATPTGPTYLPKSSFRPKATADAAGDGFLFAPGAASDESVTRNVQEMLKTINLLKNKFDDVEHSKTQGQMREGLEIPPSSGPDALVSLAKYFAGEQNGSAGNALNAADKSHNGGSSTTSDITLRLSATPVKTSDKTGVLTTVATPAISHQADDIHSSLLSERTVNHYSNLFGLQSAQGRQASPNPGEGLLSHVNNTGNVTKKKQENDYALFPQIGTTGATISALAEKPESRKIAQVFSNALSTYLEDPQTFRAQLAAIRPTEPTVVSGKPNFVPVTTTDSTLFRSGTGATYLPTKLPGVTEQPTTASSIASEINNKFDYSTPLTDLLSTTAEVFDTTTYRPRLSTSRKQKLKLELNAESSQPGANDSGEHDEFLQREQSQSFVKPRNELQTTRDKSNKANGVYIETEHKLKTTTSASAKTTTATSPTENPWNHISQADFLDPLTINDGLMKETRTTTTTFSPFTYQPKEATTLSTLHHITTIRSPSVTDTALRSGKFNELSVDAQRSHGAYTRIGSAEETTKHPAEAMPEFDAWQELFSSYNLPRDTLPSNSGLQRIANKLFGGLNETEALHLKNVMQQAEHNRQVLSLLLLLIQTCDDQNGKALERSRKHLLNALIDMDGKLQNSGGKSAHHKGSATTTTAHTPITTKNELGAAGSTTNNPTTTITRNDASQRTTTAASTTTLPGGNAGNSVEETTKFEIHVEDIDDSQTTTAASYSPTLTTVASENSISSRRNNIGGSGGGHSGHIGDASTNSDQRALELLKSLYSLASKFNSRR